MKILPKIGENEGYMHPELLGAIKRVKGCEIQLLSDNPVVAFSNAKNVIDRLNLEYLILHVPFSIIMLDMAYCNPEYREQAIRFIADVLDYSYDNNIKIDIVTHVNNSYTQFCAFGTMSFIINILDMINGSDVRLLIENSIVSLNDNDNAESTEEAIFRLVRHSHLKFCLDICHLQASENVFSKSRALTSGLIGNTSNIHFSATLDKDGYKDKKRTHGRAHKSVDDVLNDLRYLQNKGIDIEDVNIVLEINEDDYCSRPDLIREIQYFNEIEANKLI